jgi:hypothetical protein
MLILFLVMILVNVPSEFTFPVSVGDRRAYGGNY